MAKKQYKDRQPTVIRIKKRYKFDEYELRYEARIESRFIPEESRDDVNLKYERQSVDTYEWNIYGYGKILCGEEREKTLTRLKSKLLKDRVPIEKVKELELGAKNKKGEIDIRHPTTIELIEPCYAITQRTKFNEELEKEIVIVDKALKFEAGINVPQEILKRYKNISLMVDAINKGLEEEGLINEAN